MTDVEAVRAELAELSAHLQEGEEPEQWSAAWMMRQAMLQRQADLIHHITLLEAESDLEVFLVGDAVRDNAVDAGFVGSFLNRLQTTLSAIVHEIMGEEGTRGTFSDAVLEASDLQLVATGPGSFMLALEGRDYPVQTVLGEEEEDLRRPLDEALDRLMGVVDAAESDIEGAQLGEAISGLGGHRAVARAVELSNLLGQWGTGARFVRRDGHGDERRETRFSVPVARRLASVLENVETEQETITRRGRLSGVRWTSQTFDLEVEGTEDVIHGSVPLNLRYEVRNSFDRDVEATIEKTTIRTSVDDDVSETYSLVDLRTVGDVRTFRLPGIEGDV